MHQRLANRIKVLSESATLKMAQLSRQLKSEGIDIISLAIGEPDFDTPAKIKEAAIEAINNNITHYPPVAGFKELRKAIAEKYNGSYNTSYSEKNVIVSNGAKQSLSNAILCLIDHDDEVIVPSPYWVSYPEMIKMGGGKPCFIKGTLENNYKITPEQLEQAITSKTRAFLFSNPSNPSGSVYSLKELKQLAEVFKKYPDIFIISDEIYELIYFNEGPCSFSQIQDLKNRLVIINGVSKSYAMTGWRIGYMLGPEWLVEACNKLQGQTTSGACSISQMAALKALSEEHVETAQMREKFKSRRNLVLELLKQFPRLKTNVPEGAFYLLVDVSYFFGKQYQNHIITDADALAIYLLEHAHVSVVSGKAFGADKCIRISFATSDDLLAEAVVRIGKALDKLQ